MNARNIRAGGAYVEVFLKDSLQKGLDKAAQRLKSFGTGVASIGGAVMAAGAGMATPFIGAIKAASDMEETMQKFGVVFGDQAGEVKAWGDTYANQVGRSKKQIADFMGNSQDLLVPLGFEEGAATEMSKQLTGLAVDLASFNNMQDADAMNDLHAALTGSGEVMKKYGVVLTEAATKQELLNMGLDPKNATEAQKAQARFNIILAGTTNAQGDAIRSSGSFANQMKALWAEFDNANVSIGQALLPMVTKFVSSAVSGAKIVGEWVTQNQGLVRVFALVAGGLMAGGAALLLVGGMAIAAGWGLSLLSMGLGVAASMATALGGALAFLVSPVGLVIAAIAGGGAALLYFSGVGGDIIAFLADRFGFLWGVVQAVFAGIVNSLKAGDISGAANVLWLALKVAWTAGIGQLSALWDAFKNTSLRIFDELRFGVVKIFAAMLSKLAGLMQAAGDFLGIDQLTDTAKALDQLGRETGQGAQMVTDQNAANRAKEAQRKQAQGQADLMKATEELDRALLVAAAKASSAKIEDEKRALEYGKRGGTGGGDGDAQVEKVMRSVTGTFSGAAASRFRAVSSPLEKQIADASTKTADNTGKMVEEIKKLKGPTFT